MTAEELKELKAQRLKEAKEKGLIAYRYLAGSHSQNLNGPDSDEDFHGVYFAEPEQIIGLGDDYLGEIADKKNDETYHEFGKWMYLLSKGNPDVIESLFVPENMVIGEIHPVIRKVIAHRDEFLSKQVVNALAHYAFDQVKKARGLNKKIVNKVTERKDVLDFCYTFKGQGSQPIKEFLAEHHLDQRYCGLVNVPNMPYMYAVFYDFAAYFKFENKGQKEREEIMHSFQINPGDTDPRFIMYDILGDNVRERIDKKEFFGYAGIVQPDDISRSNTVRLSSIQKGETPICRMSYNKDAYTSHCKKYRETKEWERDRNQKRYSKAEEAGYNQKNMCHCIRLLTMAKEISDGKGFNIWRTDDRDFLMGIKNGDYTYEYLLDYAEKLLDGVNESLAKSELPDEVDKDFVKRLAIKYRKEYYNINGF